MNNLQDHNNSTEVLKQKLSDYGILWQKWGTGPTKTLEHLVHEITEGETSLVEKEGELLRQVGVVTIEVTYHDNGNIYKLIEYRQEFVDGRTRHRKLKSSICEKLKPNETPDQTVKFCLKEELGLEIDKKLKPIKTEEDIEDSPSYPGLKTRYLLHRFAIDLPMDKYSSSGYTEKQPDKTPYYAWQKVARA